ncbi:MAG TPA: histidine--tRNA ligase [Acidimicrobiia bacterium]|nr:histidine--tRNA ligase [Acidimicrobiia bacterium]
MTEHDGEDPSAPYRAPTGTHDVLPPDSRRWARVVTAFAGLAERFGYGLIITPVFEHSEVFQRVGASTDVVRKEMYEFVDRGGRSLALRPEGTAPVVRAYVQHRPTPPWKTWYVAPNFRYERPQKGRYRQHWQLGAEVLGVDDPDVDVEIITLAARFYEALGLQHVRLLVNSMGQPADRARYIDVLRAHLLAHADGLGEEFRTRAEQHPLRLLDAKVEEWQDVLERAPQLTEHLGDDARRHFERVQAGLDELGITYELSPRLVRGFDYYTSTTFEFASDALDAAQNAVGGGGRYDSLAEKMHGPPTPGIGFGIGIERVLIACDAEAVLLPEGPVLDAFVIDGVGDGTASVIVTALRDSGLRADRAYGGRSVKAQWKLADRSGAAFGVMLGRAEADRAAVAVKRLATGEQIEVPREHVAGWIRARLEEAP